MEEIQTIVFDLDGTIYQDNEFYKDYLHFLVEGTPKESWADELIAYVSDVFEGKGLQMNSFYASDRIEAKNPQAYVHALEGALLPELSYEEATGRENCINTGDAWAVVTLIGETLGLLGGERQDAVYRRTRERMRLKGVHGSDRLRNVVLRLNARMDTILLSNSYQSTALEFLRQLGFDGVFQKAVFSANKPFGLVETLLRQDAASLNHPGRVLCIGDHAFNDLLPLQRLGCRTLWVNPFEHIHKPEYDDCVRTPEELAEYLETMCRSHQHGFSLT